MKNWLLFGAVLTMLGLILFAGAMTAGGWDFSALDTNAFLSSEYEFEEAICDISVLVGDADVLFTPSEGEKCRVVVYERENETHTVSLSEGVLSVRAENEGVLFHHVGINVKNPKVTIFLPEREYGVLNVKGKTGTVRIPSDFRFERAEITLTTGETILNASVSGALNVTTSTGDIAISGITAREMTLSVTTGEIRLSGVTCAGTAEITVSTGETVVTDLNCAAFISSGSTGDITLKNVTASKTIRAERSTGDVRIIDSDAAALSLKTTTGSVSGSIRSEKIYSAKTSTGSVSVPDSSSGGTCEIKTTTGDIRFR